jgi:hypothetical protein
MNLFVRLRKILIALSLVFVLMTTAACGATATNPKTSDRPAINNTNTYSQVERGNTASGQDFGQWVVQTSKGLVQDAYVRGNDMLGVVISPQVRPMEVRQLSKSLMQGFEKNFPNRNLKVLMYAPDKKLILTALYDKNTRQIEYQ